MNAHLTIYNVQEGGLRDVSTGFDRIPSNPRWTPDSRRILFTAGDSVYREVFAYDVASKRYDKLTDKRFVGLGSVSADGSRVAFTLESAEVPSDVYVSGLDFSTVEKLTDVHPDTRELEAWRDGSHPVEEYGRFRGRRCSRGSPSATFRVSVIRS